METSTFKRIKVTPNDLLLDPNNPRLVHDLNSGEKVSDCDVLGKQKKLLRQFQEDETDEFTNITDLYTSMLQVGYVGIDRVVVRELEGQDKYLVIEGNRRTSCLKLILDKAKTKFGNKETEWKQYLQNKDSFEQIDVLLLKTKGLSDTEVEDRISTILGLRHFGSVLDWKPVNRAYHAYLNYMSTEPRLTAFMYDDKRLREVSNRLGVDRNSVKKLLQTYIVYKQLIESTGGVEEDHYSLIESGTSLARFNYFNRCESSFELDEPSLSKLASLCQFGERKSTKPEGLIIRKPQKFGVLGKILRISQTHKNEYIRQRALTLISAIERGEKNEANEIAPTVDAVHSELLAEINRKGWVEALHIKLKEQEKKLPIEKYDGEGNHLVAKTELKQAMVNIRMIYGV